MGKNVSFMLGASNPGGDEESRHLSNGPTPAPTPDNQGTRAFIGGERELHVETVWSALIVTLKLGMRWSDQRHLDCFKYS